MCITASLRHKMNLVYDFYSELDNDLVRGLGEGSSGGLRATLNTITLRQKTAQLGAILCFLDMA
jgi:hypothetical protein